MSPPHLSIDGDTIVLYGEAETANGILRETEGDDFLLDGCAAIVNSVDGHLIRTPR